MTEPNRQSGEKEERIIEIEIERLRPFKEHPFQVKDITLTQRITSLKRQTGSQNVRKKKKHRLQKRRKPEKNSQIRNRKQRSTIWNSNKK